MVAKLTQDTVIEQFKAKHGDTYDYSKVVYKGIDTKVEIICKEHDIFLQTPYEHRKGNGCAKCGNIKATLTKGQIPSASRLPKVDGRKGRKLTTEVIVERFKAVHGDKYDYSQVSYVSSETPVLIGCTVHGFVPVTTFQHTNTDGCPECGKLKKKPTISFESFVEMARATHGDKYSYHADSFSRMQDLTRVHCKAHGDFHQSATSHVQGRGCQKCALIVMGNTHRDSPSEFIEKVIARHGDSLDFSKVAYQNHYTPVDVVCPKHTMFSIKPNLLVNGQGCPECSKEAKSAKARHTKEDFVRKAEAIHGKGTYDYSLVDYQTSKVNVTIICAVGHVFQQTPHNHTAGKHGCPSCGPCGFDARKDSWLYILSAEGMSKLGITNRDALTRAKSIAKSAGFPFTVEAEYNLEGQFCSDLESKLLRQYRLCYRNPTPAFQGSSECFMGLSVETIKSDIAQCVEKQYDQTKIRPGLGDAQDLPELQE